jgi:stage II sporulation protein E
MIAEQKNSSKDDKLRSISDSFSNLSEIFYNLSTKLKRPSMLDLRGACEGSFECVCKECENREHCFGTEYSSTLDTMKKITVQLHSFGVADEKKLPESFKKRCPNAKIITEKANRACAIATKKAFQNEKTEIFALDYDAISKILNDAISENEEEFKIDASMSKKVAAIIEEDGYGSHNVSVFGKRKIKIIARGLDLCDKSGDVSSLIEKLEDATGAKLKNPTFELAFGSVNMQTEAKRAYSAESAFANASCDGESICGDTVSIFENKNDYLYALISDGMGTGRSAALASETANVFLRNMLTAGNRMETSLRMLNSVLRVKGSKSEDECSATVDLLQLDLYSGALTLIKSGAAPTFVLRRGNVFKLASPSFPIGILRAIDAKQLNIQCEDGDVIVMISDGATRGGDECPYLNSLLRESDVADEAPEKIADKIIRRAKAEADAPSDDISVIVVKVKKEICNW